MQEISAIVKTSLAVISKNEILGFQNKIRRRDKHVALHQLLDGPKIYQLLDHKHQNDCKCE